jgi:hypothetical protein
MEEMDFEWDLWSLKRRLNEAGIAQRQVAQHEYGNATRDAFLLGVVEVMLDDREGEQDRIDGEVGALFED